MAQQLESLAPYLNRKTLFVRDLDQKLTKQEIKTELARVCPKDKGSVCVPVDYSNAQTLSCAYCNFNTTEDALQAFLRHRHSLKIRGKLVKVIYAVDDPRNRERVFGPWGLRFFIIVKNLSSNVDAPALCSRFEQYGEVFQCKVDLDNYGYCYGMVQFVEERAAREAVEKANRTLLGSTVISVEPHQKHGSGGGARTGSGPLPALSTPRPPSPLTDGSSSSSSPLSRSSAAVAAVAGAASITRVPTPAAAEPSPRLSSSPDATATSSSSSVPPTAARSASIGPSTPPSATAAAVGNDPTWATAAATPSTSDRSAPTNATSPHHHTTVPATAAAHSNGRSTMPGPSAGSPARTAPLMQLLSEHHNRRVDAVGPQQQLQAYMHQPPPPPPSQPSQQQTQKQQQQPQLQRQQQQPSAASRSGEAASAHATASLHRAPLRSAPPQLSIRDSTRSMLLAMDRLSDMLCCPITQELFVEPLIAADGHSYEAHAIREWLMSHDTSPMTNKVLPNKTLIPNNLLKVIVQEFA